MLSHKARIENRSDLSYKQASWMKCNFLTIIPKLAEKRHKQTLRSTRCRGERMCSLRNEQSSCFHKQEGDGLDWRHTDKQITDVGRKA